MQTLKFMGVVPKAFAWCLSRDENALGVVMVYILGEEVLGHIAPSPSQEWCTSGGTRFGVHVLTISLLSPFLNTVVRGSGSSWCQNRHLPPQEPPVLVSHTTVTASRMGMGSSGLCSMSPAKETLGGR